MTDKEIILSNGNVVLKSNYIKMKTLDLISFGYSTLIEKDVAEQVEKIINNETDLSVIGMFCKDDLKID